VDQEYIAAVAEAADASLASLQAPRILPLLRQVAFGEPLNESLQARLILVLAATGQQQQALARYQAVRERLSDELGVDPGAEMRTAHSKVLRQEFLTGGQAVSISSPPDTPSPLVPPAQLPADLPTFAGREWELSQLSAMLRPGSEFPGTVAIHVIGGMAGIGKTTFAIHWAHHVAKHFEDGQLYLNLRGFDSSDSATAPVDALGALLYSLGVPPRHIPGDPDACAGLYRSVLAGKRILIVLDNARDAEQVRPLLPGSPGCLIIATSRNPLTGLAMTEGARLLTLRLPPVLTARETLERRLGTGRVAAEPEAVEKLSSCAGGCRWLWPSCPRGLPPIPTSRLLRSPPNSGARRAASTHLALPAWTPTHGPSSRGRTVSSARRPAAFSGCCRCGRPLISRLLPPPACSAHYRKKRTG
jgi:hypothetical protein